MSTPALRGRQRTVNTRMNELHNPTHQTPSHTENLTGPPQHGPTRYSRHETAHRRTRFIAACAVADMPETTRLAGTIEKW